MLRRFKLVLIPPRVRPHNFSLLPPSCDVLTPLDSIGEYNYDHYSDSDEESVLSEEDCSSDTILRRSAVPIYFSSHCFIVDAQAQLNFGIDFGLRFESEEDRLQPEIPSAVPQPSATRPTLKYPKGQYRRLRNSARILYLERYAEEGPEHGDFVAFYDEFLDKFEPNPSPSYHTFRNWCTTPALGRGRDMRNPGGGRQAFLSEEEESMIVQAVEFANERHMAIPVYVLRAIAPMLVEKRNGAVQLEDEARLRFSLRWVGGLLKRHKLALRTPAQVQHGNRHRTIEDLRVAIKYWWFALYSLRHSTFC